MFGYALARKGRMKFNNIQSYPINDSLFINKTHNVSPPLQGRGVVSKWDGVLNEAVRDVPLPHRGGESLVMVQIVYNYQKKVCSHIICQL